MKRRTVIGGGLAALGALATPAYLRAQSSKKLSFLSWNIADQDVLFHEQFAAFKKENPGVEIEWLDKKGTELPAFYQTQLVAGTAVFLTSDPMSAPTALMHSLKHYKVLHEQNVILSVVTAPQPVVPDSERIKMETINDLFMRIKLTFGYMEQPNIPRALSLCRRQGWKFDIMTTSFFLSRRSLKASPKSGMPVWQDKLFIGLARSAADATEYFQIPTGRVVEIGTQVAI